MTLKQHARTTCECGSEKSRTAPACDECMWRDGTTARETRVIDALRSAGSPVNVRQVASLSDTTERSVLRSVIPLIKCGRVVKTAGPPTLYKLGETRRKEGKAQGELEGFERECIEELDEAIAELVDAEQQLREWKARRDESKQLVDQRMIKNEKVLDSDEDGDRVYVYQDGVMRHVATLPCEDQKRHAKVVSKRVPRQEPDDA